MDSDHWRVVRRKDAVFGELQICMLRPKALIRVGPIGHSVDELRVKLAAMLDACELDVLDEDEARRLG
jgi:hypothetical protein